MRFMPAGNMNFDQWMSFIRFVGIFLGGIFVTKGVLSEKQVTDLINQIVAAAPVVINTISVITPIVMAVWGIIRQSHKSQVLATSEIPGVAKVQIKATAASDLVTIAKDSAIPKVTLIPKSEAGPMPDVPHGPTRLP